MYPSLVLLLGFGAAGCAAAQSADALKHSDPAGPTSFRVTLPVALAEVSGLAYTPDGRLFAPGDEQAVVYQIDLARGRPVKRFGDNRVRIDTRSGVMASVTAPGLSSLAAAAAIRFGSSIFS
jgi:hypothetical protein